MVTADKKQVNLLTLIMLIVPMCDGAISLEIRSH